MSEYQFNKETENDGIYTYKCKSKFANQTIEVEFTPYVDRIGLNKDRYFYVAAVIYHKRKDKIKLFENVQSSGKIGISGLIIMKNIILSFIDYLNEMDSVYNNYIIVNWSDSKRGRVYKNGLERYGFTYGMLGGYLSLYKKC